MSTSCTTPREPGDTRYVYGVCTWHGPIAEAGKRRDGTPCCPQCTGKLFEMPTEAAWQDLIDRADRDLPGYAEMVRWGRLQCFPDYDVLSNAYRQHMEGR